MPQNSKHRCLSIARSHAVSRSKGTCYANGAQACDNRRSRLHRRPSSCPLLWSLPDDHQLFSIACCFCILAYEFLKKRILLYVNFAPVPAPNQNYNATRMRCVWPRCPLRRLRNASVFSDWVMMKVKGELLVGSRVYSCHHDSAGLVRQRRQHAWCDGQCSEQEATNVAYCY